MAALLHFPGKGKGGPISWSGVADLLCGVTSVRPGERRVRKGGGPWLVGRRQGGRYQKQIDGGELTVWKLTETRASAEGIVRLGGWSAAGY